MGDRVVDCARLESVCAPKGHRGFESLPIRQLENNGIIARVIRPCVFA
jgi:hypothetical protein